MQRWMPIEKMSDQRHDDRIELSPLKFKVIIDSYIKEGELEMLLVIYADF